MPVERVPLSVRKTSLGRGMAAAGRALVAPSSRASSRESSGRADARPDGATPLRRDRVSGAQPPPRAPSSRTNSGSCASERLDFDQEARKLWQRLNLDPSIVDGGQHNAMDPIWRHPRSSALLFVGNQTAAKSLQLLQRHAVTHVVNCTDNMPCYHEGPISYFRFDITSHYSRVQEDQGAVAFVEPMLSFVSAALEQGHSVMVHCLAGAHRAGTTGVICLMRFAGLSVAEAIPAAKRLRPIIEPIGGFPELLARIERGWLARGGPT